MCVYRVQITVDNAAFGESREDRNSELARLLRELAQKLENGQGAGAQIRDINGQTVGAASLYRK